MILTALASTLVAATAAGAAPTNPLAVVPVVRGDSITPAHAEALAAWTREAVVEAGYRVLTAEERRERMGKQNPASCRTGADCFAFIARSLGVPVLIRVEGGAVERDLAVVVQAIRADDGKVLAETTLMSTTDVTREAFLESLRPFVDEFTSNWPPHREVAAADHAPDAMTDPGNVADVEEPGSVLTNSRMAAIGLGALAVGFGAYGVSRLSARGEAIANREAAREANRAVYDEEIQRYTAGAGVGIGVAVACAAGAAFLATRDDGAEAEAPAISFVPLRDGGGWVGIRWEVR